MQPSSQPTALPAPTPSPSLALLHIAPGQSLWACLAPGSRVHATQGDVAIRLAPRLLGHALHSPPLALLRAGDHLPWVVEHRQATWVQLGSATQSPAEVRVVEGTPVPGLGQRAWRRLRRAFAVDGTARTQEAHGALHTAR